jgi:predicted secreted hydrolase
VNRREFVLAGLAFPLVTPDYRLQFPRDHGAHPDFRQEWWYVTGWLKTERGQDLGFQVTFFRTRLDIDTRNPSSFTPSQVILAHAALSDPRHGRLRHDERAARTALGLAGSREGNTRVWVDDWSLDLSNQTYRTKIQARDFSLDLEFQSQGAPLLQGEAGFSRKGNRPEEASYYYSRPQLSVRGFANREKVTGKAWLDHEWSSQYMAANATGWDWCGVNLDGGGALMAFRMRD